MAKTEIPRPKNLESINNDIMSKLIFDHMGLKNAKVSANAENIYIEHDDIVVGEMFEEVLKEVISNYVDDPSILLSDEERTVEQAKSYLKDRLLDPQLDPDLAAIMILVLNGK